MTIDWWTLALQAVNVLILVWLLGRFFFKPVSAAIEKRQAEARALTAEAAAERDKASAQLREIAAIREGFATEHDKLVAEAHKAAEDERQRLLKEAAEDAARAREDQDAALKRERAEAQKALVARASDLAVDIAGRLLGRVPPEAVTAAFIDALPDAIAALGADRKALLATAAAGETGLGIVSATKLSDTERHDVETALGEALGPVTKFTYETDPRLIAGLDIRSGSAVFRHSLQHDLERIRADLGGGNGQRT